MSGQRAAHTLQPTALVHEAYLRLVGDDQIRWAGRSHFFFAAAQAMRSILIDHARAHAGKKRGGDRKRISFQNVLDLAADGEFEEILTLDDALSRLEEKVSATAATVVRLRFYGGLTIEEAAETMGVSTRTVEREWTFARAWLIRELDPDGR
jgi:RNA polymerase sigma factor (TIGR02999 family)